MDADTHGKGREALFDTGNIEVLQGLVNLQGGFNGPQFLVWVAKGRSPNGDCRIPNELIQHPLILEDDLVDDAEILVQGLD